ncbi:PREDICTED: perilipin-2-like isoform X1 [Cyprinodon variegatus]|uniref:perilipin-2-like isoform X1 n=1 Tax=Cyprinodon variegatus TaxID=28743 RepID=UPI000742BAD7|nr:PREDICTED: perilipin-2-like isoform X1 [Cyprinodon variegatus]
MLTTFLVFEKCREMPVNNNYKKVAPNAAARFTKLPLVRSACSTLALLYRDVKSRNQSLKSVCEALESRVTSLTSAACSTASPVIVKLEPQISIANDFACKGLDWLESSFPVLLSPPDEIVAAAKNKVNEIQDVACSAASGTWMIGRLHQTDGAKQSVVERAVGVACVGLDSALTLSEALVDQVLPPSEEEKEEVALLVEGFEAVVRSGSFSGRVMKLTAQVCRRMYHMVGLKIHSVQITGSSSRPATLVQEFHTGCQSMLWSLQALPQFLQHQAVSVFLFIRQMYNLSCPSSQMEKQTKSHIRAAEASLLSKEKAHPQSTTAFRMRPTRTSVFENGCLVKGCVRR